MKLISLLMLVVGAHAVHPMDLATDAEILSKYWDEIMRAREVWLPSVMEPMDLGCAADAEFIWNDAPKTCTPEVENRCVYSIKPIW